MSNTINLIKKACKEVGLNYKQLDSVGIFISVSVGRDRNHFFIANNSGLNSENVAKICLDKYYTYVLLHKNILMPKQESFVDANSPEIYRKFRSFDNNNKITDWIKTNLSFPVIVKPNSKSMGINVFKSNNSRELELAISTIFNKNSLNYDHVLLVQEHVNIVSEYRVIVYNKKIQFFYKKNNDNAKFVDNLSPLHWDNAYCELIKNDELEKELQVFIDPIFNKLDLKYGGLDIVRDKNGQLWLIEINNRPGFGYLIRDNFDKDVVEMYKKILIDLNKFEQN